MIDSEILTMFWRVILSDVVHITAALILGFVLGMLIVSILVKTFRDLL